MRDDVVVCLPGRSRQPRSQDRVLDRTAPAADDGLCEVHLVLVGARERNRECAHAVPAGGGGRNCRGRVEPAAQFHADRHVGPQAADERTRSVTREADLQQRLARARVRAAGAPATPSTASARELHLARPTTTTRAERSRSLEERRVIDIPVAECDEVADSLRVDVERIRAHACTETLDLRGPVQRASRRRAT